MIYSQALGYCPDATCSPKELGPVNVLGYSCFISFFAQRLDVREAIDDPSRVFNQDETAAELGIGSQWVLVP